MSNWKANKFQTKSSQQTKKGQNFGRSFKFIPQRSYNGSSIDCIYHSNFFYSNDLRHRQVHTRCNTNTPIYDMYVLCNVSSSILFESFLYYVPFLWIEQYVLLVYATFPHIQVNEDKILLSVKKANWFSNGFKCFAIWKSVDCKLK